MSSVASRRRLFLLSLVVGYGTLFLLHLHHINIDACLDAGGVIETATGSCVGYRQGEYLLLLERPWSFWVFAVLVPAIPVVALGFLTRRLWKRHK